MNTGDHHGYRVTWSEEDGEYVATTDCWSSLSYLAPDPVDALAGLVRIITWDEDGVNVPVANGEGHTHE